MKLPTPFWRFVRAVQGQATVEYILMLSSVIVILSALLTAFHKTFVRWLFAFIGQLLTS